MSTIIIKLCNRCGEIGEFYVRKNGKSQDCCKRCFNKRGSQYQVQNKDSVNFRARVRYSKNPEKYKNQSKSWYERNPLIRKSVSKNYYENHKDDILRKNKVWAHQNTDAVRNKSRKWRLLHPEKIKAFRDSWFFRHPEKMVEYNNSRRSRISGKITSKEWKELKDKYGNICLCCGRSDVKLTLDHIVPLVKGGLNVIENAQPLCKSCNSKKGTKTEDYRRLYDKQR